MKELTPELEKLINEIGTLVRSDPRYTEFERASEAYASDPEINRCLTEYNVQQQALADAYGSENRDEALIEAVQARINQLYAQITESPVYVVYREAGERYEAFSKALYSEIEFAVTGKRASCNHDCSSCGGCH